MFTLIFMLAKGVKLTFLFEGGGWLPQALFWSYLIIVYFLLVNMFMAIVQDTYTLVNFANANKTKKQFAQDSIIWYYLLMLQFWSNQFGSMMFIYVSGSEPLPPLGVN